MSTTTMTSNATSKRGSTMTEPYPTGTEQLRKHLDDVSTATSDIADPLARKVMNRLIDSVLRAIKDERDQRQLDLYVETGGDATTAVKAKAPTFSQLRCSEAELDAACDALVHNEWAEPWRVHRGPSKVEVVYAVRVGVPFGKG